MAKGDDIEERLLNLSVAVVKLCSKLPKTLTGTHIASQLLRSGTAPPPNYAEARGAESRKDFIHKLGITLKELNESHIWLEMVGRVGIVPEAQVKALAKECTELARIIYKSIQTASGTLKINR